METEIPSTEKQRARYLGKAAVYSFCVSSVAMPSSSSYSLETSPGALTVAFDVAPLKSLRKVGTEVRKINIKAVKPAMEEVLWERSIRRDRERFRKCGSVAMWKWREMISI